MNNKAKLYLNNLRFVCLIIGEFHRHRRQTQLAVVACFPSNLANHLSTIKNKIK